MNAPLAHSRAVDLLAQAIEYARGDLDRTKPINERVRIFWAAVVAARNLGASDVVRDEFVQLATEVGLSADLGQHAAETIGHLVRWGLFARNPFGKVT
jgi:hypothetical protein